jgi:hypothetical protein
MAAYESPASREVSEKHAAAPLPCDYCVRHATRTSQEHWLGACNVRLKHHLLEFLLTLTIGDTAPGLFRPDHRGTDQVPRLDRRQLGGAVLPPPRLHPGVHHRAGVHGEDQTRVRPRNVKIVGRSVDPLENHAQWAQDIADTQGAAPNYPLIADTDFAVSKAYGMLPADPVGDQCARTPTDNATLRNVFAGRARQKDQARVWSIP